MIRPARLRCAAALAAFASLMSLPALADDLSTRSEVIAFADQMAKEDGFVRNDLLRLFDQVVLKPRVIETLEKPGTAKPWYQYHPSFINPTRIKHGVEFMQVYAGPLAEAERRYGVPPEIIAAILGVETNYGRNAGSFRVLDVLTTVAFDYPRRADDFKKELREFLLLARADGGNPLSYKGSYAGAMGWPQFMPSSYNRYAVDGDGDGHRDIWNNPTDVIMSVAHYLAEFGWQRGGDLVVRAKVTGETYPTLIAERFALNRTVADMAAFGVQPETPVDATQKAILFPLEVQPGTVENWIGLPNFFVITRYNRSTLYAMSIVRLAEGIRSAMTTGG